MFVCLYFLAFRRTSVFVFRFTNLKIMLGLSFLVSPFALGCLWIGWHAETSALMICRSSLLARNDTTPSSILSSSCSSSPLPPDGVAAELYFLWFTRPEMTMFSSLEYCSRWSSLDSRVLILLSFSAFSLSSRFTVHSTWAISCRTGNSSSNFALMNDMFFLRSSMSSDFGCSVLDAALVFPHCRRATMSRQRSMCLKCCLTVMIVNNSHRPGWQ